MQKVDPAFLFETGDASRAVRRIVEDGDKIDTWLKLNETSNSIRTCIYQSIYKDYFHAPLFNAGSTVVRLCEELMAHLFPTGEEPRNLLGWQITSLNNAYTKFETILVSELQSISSYIVTKKAGFDTEAMVEAGKVFFSKDLEAKVPGSIADLEQAMRCIAFEVPTAAGFHLHRANESVLRVYWDNVTSSVKRPKQNNMGAYLDGLNKMDKGNKSVRAHLQSIKDFHRNPLMHPDQSLDTTEEAIDLMAAIRCAIGYMLKEIPFPEAPLLVPSLVPQP